MKPSFETLRAECADRQLHCALNTEPSRLGEKAGNMFAQFQTSYRRMEDSLQRLTDSIAAYNPSPAAADELLAADDAVNEDLEQRKWSRTTDRRSKLTSPSIAAPGQLCSANRSAPHHGISGPEHQRHRQTPSRRAQRCHRYPRGRQCPKVTARS